MTRRVRRKAEVPIAPSTPRHASPQQLLEAADLAREASYAPYSHFPVGAALLTRGGRVFRGCNVENSSFGLSMCAERTALLKAVSEGEREFAAVAITAGPGAVPTPCGACRQVLHEFAPDMWVFWRDAAGRIVGRKLEELLSSPFVFLDPKASAPRRATKGKVAARGAMSSPKPKAKPKPSKRKRA